MYHNRLQRELWEGVKIQMNRVDMKSSDHRLLEGFDWAKQQALVYAHAGDPVKRTGDPVGDWYEAALPGRDAFCMRDVSHQGTGAQVLGLGSHNRNMLLKFAYNISESKDWCTYWEINKYDQPAPVDYTNDQHFWYCLPANFDVLDCCYRQYLWTGDLYYIRLPIFLHFYDRTVNEYVARWDIDGDGLLEHLSKHGFRGLGTYNEGRWDIMTGADLIASQYAGYLAYANIQEIRDNKSLAEEYRAKARRLKVLFNEKWWDEEAQEYYAAQLQDHSFWHPDIEGREEGRTLNHLPLYFGIVEEGRRTELVLDNLVKRTSEPGLEEKSYLPEIFWKHGRNDAAYDVLLQLTDPGLKRCEYPEVSYSVIGSVATGMMGLSPDAGNNMISTMPRLTDETEWVEVRNIPVFGNKICIRHVENEETTFINQSGPAVMWKATSPIEVDELLLDGTPIRATQEIGINGRKISYVTVNVKEGEQHKISAP